MKRVNTTNIKIPKKYKKNTGQL